MVETNVRTGIVCVVFATGFLSLCSGAWAKQADPEETCKNQLLTYHQRYQCQEELENIQTKADEKKVVRKFTDLIRAAEKAKEDEK